MKPFLQSALGIAVGLVVSLLLLSAPWFILYVALGVCLGLLMALGAFVAIYTAMDSLNKPKAEPDATAKGKAVCYELPSDFLSFRYKGCHDIPLRIKTAHEIELDDLRAENKQLKAKLSRKTPRGPRGRFARSPRKNAR